MRGPAATLRRRAVSLLAPPAEGPVSRSHVATRLSGRAAQGAAATLVGQWLRLLLQTGSTVLLARLLTPREYGLVGMVTAIVGIGDIVWTLGLSTATVQRLTITTEQVNAFFWLQVALGAVMTIVTIASAHTIAAFYHSSAVVTITVVFAFNFLLGGLSAQHLALLSRQMRFILLSLIEVVGLLLGLVVAIAIALRGGGYWALVAQLMTLSVVRIAISWPASGWRPSRPRRVEGLWPVIRFGLNLGLTNGLDYASLNADNVLLGRFYGAGVLGLYARAYNLLMLPVRQIHLPIARVAVPVLSYLQDSPQRFRRYYRTAMSAVAYASLPTLALLAALAPEVVRLMLGPRWSGVAPVFRVLALAGALTTFRAPNGWLFVATGHTGRQAAWAVFNRPVIIGSFVAGLPWGATGVAWGLVASTAGLLVPAFVIAVKDTPVTLRDVCAANWRPAVVGSATFAVGIAARTVVGSGHPALTIAVAVAAVGALIAALYVGWPAFRRDIAELRSALRRRPDATRAAQDTAATPAVAPAGGA